VIRHTPIWFAEKDDKLYVMTRSDSAKYKYQEQSRNSHRSVHHPWKNHWPRVRSHGPRSSDRGLAVGEEGSRA
jgi:hypothetical protein